MATSLHRRRLYLRGWGRGVAGEGQRWQSNSGGDTTGSSSSAAATGATATSGGPVTTSAAGSTTPVRMIPTAIVDGATRAIETREVMKAAGARDVEPADIRKVT